MTGVCPWCDAKALFQVVFGPGQAGDDKFERIYGCVACERHIYELGRAQLTQGAPQWLETTSSWPPPGAKAAADPAVPSAIAADWIEAHSSLGVRAFKATVAMARRAVQGVCVDTGAGKGHLADQVKELVKAGSLNPQLGEWANHIRVLGNVGAHPGDDGLNTVTQDEAEDVLAFLDELLRWTYILPEQLSQARARRPSTP